MNVPEMNVKALDDIFIQGDCLSGTIVSQHKQIFIISYQKETRKFVD
jgi:hypothetical protein